MDSTPITILTGFLGSGKTTLLKRLLEEEPLGDTAILINEFGDVGIDNLLVEAISEDVVLLPGGCVCCVVRGDLREALLDLYNRREQGEIPFFKRVLLETTGLADPAPIRSTLLKDTHVRGRFHFALQITVVDAVHAKLQEKNNKEWLGQVGAADRILLSKTDLVSLEQQQDLAVHLKELNPYAELVLTQDIKPGDLLLLDEGLAGERPLEEVERWSLWQGKTMQMPSHAQTISLEFEQPLDWVVFGVWLSLLLRCHGTKILRVKGLLEIEGSEMPVVVHGVQHSLHLPVHLDRRPKGMRGSCLVFITKGLDPSLVKRSFLAFMQKAQG